MESKEDILISRSRKGDVEAFETLITGYLQKVYVLAYRFMGNPEDASDLAQEALVRAFQAIGKFRQEASFKTWLFRIVANVCRDELRRQKRKREVSLDEPLIITNQGEIQRETADWSRSPEGIFEQKEQQKYLQKIIEGLPPEYRLVIIMRDIQSFSYQEIAEVLGCSLGTVKSRLFRARRVLREKLQKELLEQETRLTK